MSTVDSFSDEKTYRIKNIGTDLFLDLPSDGDTQMRVSPDGQLWVIHGSQDTTDSNSKTVTIETKEGQYSFTSEKDEVDSKVILWSNSDESIMLHRVGGHNFWIYYTDLDLVLSTDDETDKVKLTRRIQPGNPNQIWQFVEV